MFSALSMLAPGYLLCLLFPLKLRKYPKIFFSGREDDAFRRANKACFILTATIRQQGKFLGLTTSEAPFHTPLAARVIFVDFAPTYFSSSKLRKQQNRKTNLGDAKSSGGCEN